jgi:hypothetical protein
MPAPSRWMIRCALCYLLIGVAIGGLILTSKAYPSLVWSWTLLPIHIEFAIFGWIIQLTMGTAYWILPRFLSGDSRGNVGAAKGMVATLNGGIMINVITYLDVLPEWGIVAGRLLETSAVVLFITLHWKRVVSYR